MTRYLKRLSELVRLKTKSVTRCVHRRLDRRAAFTLLELTVVVVLIFFLASTLIVMIPKIEERTSIKRAKNDISRLELALALHREIKGWYPPDCLFNFNNYPASGVSSSTAPPSPVPWLTHKDDGADDWRPSPVNSAGFTVEEMSNILLVHFLTAGKDSKVFIEFDSVELTPVGFWNTDPGNTATAKRRQLDPAYSYLNNSPKFGTLSGMDATNQRTVYTFNDPWGNPYIYDNNDGLPANSLFQSYDETPEPDPSDDLPFRRNQWDNGSSTNSDPNTWFNGAPNNNPDFDLYSMGPNSITALLSTGDGNGLDDSDGTPNTDPTYGSPTYEDSDWDDAFYNGRERDADGEIGDDVNNFKRGQ